MTVFIRTIFLLVVTALSTNGFAHEGHLTSGTIFHLAEHVGVALLVLTVGVIALMCVARKRSKKSK